MNDIWDLDWKEREQIISNRYNKTKYIVWDYAPSTDGKIFGTMEKLPSPTDYGFVHGFKITTNNVIRSCDWNVIKVYTNNWHFDETWETRKIHPFHVFSTLEKASEYSKKAIENLNKTITLADILPIVKKYYSTARIAEGCRGYEGNAKYECIVFQSGYYTMQITDDGKSILWRGGTFDNDVVVPHIDLLDKCLDIRKNGRDGDDGYNDLLEYCMDEWNYYKK